MDSHLIDVLFREAVAFLESGRLDGLQRLLAANPSIATARLTEPGPWLCDRFGGKLPDFFQQPYLLWFVAEDPVRTGQLPRNIALIAQTILDVARRDDPANIQQQLDVALRMVSWSTVARRSGVQIELIDVLADAGASLAGNPENALVNRNVAAAEHLVDRGAPLTLASALCLDRWADVSRLLPTTPLREQRLALVLAALNGNAEALRHMIRVGADINAPSPDLYSHGTPLHHAVCSGSLEAVQALVKAGANLHTPDTAWNGTPLGWALHYVEEKKEPGERARYIEIADYLRLRSDSDTTGASS